jgi:hypothetical protein
MTLPVFFGPASASPQLRAPATMKLSAPPSTASEEERKERQVRIADLLQRNQVKNSGCDRGAKPGEDGALRAPAVREVTGRKP